MDNLFLEDVPEFGALYRSCVLYEYEGIPLLFLCENVRKDLFLVFCSESYKSEQWTIVATTKQTVQNLLDKKITLYEGITIGNKGILAKCDFSKSTKTNYAIMSTKNISILELPPKSSYLSYVQITKIKQYLDSYCDKQIGVDKERKRL